MNAKDIIELLFKHFDVYTIKELSNKMGVSQSVVSSWKSRNAINAIENRCRRLGIYHDIYSQEVNENIQNSQSDSLQSIENLALLKALNSVATAFNKKEELRESLKKIMSDLID